MRPSLFVFIVLPFVSFADIPPKVPSTSIDSSKLERQRKEAEENYRRGLRLVEGAGSAGDYAAAARFYRRAAEAGHAAAQSSLAYLYENGLGVERDCTQAALWYRKAAE
jgi:TPR repeat protein